MKKQYDQPTMRVFSISSDERIAANCQQIHNQVGDFCNSTIQDNDGSGCWDYNTSIVS